MAKTVYFILYDYLGTCTPLHYFVITAGTSLHRMQPRSHALLELLEPYRYLFPLLLYVIIYMLLLLLDYLGTFIFYYFFLP